MDKRECERIYYQTHKHIWVASYKRRREKIRQQKDAWRQKHRVYMRDYVRKRTATMKEKVILHYGNDKMVCMKCGVSDIRALSIDHINAGEEKPSTRRSGTMFYRWLIKNNYPEGYQTLCMNCQFIKRHERNECHRID